MPDPLHSAQSEDAAPGDLRERIWRIIFLSDTPAGRTFDMVLLLVISASVLVG
jgi:hypothetical protein